ncbi:5-oxoprolinase subunit PxpB [Shewanella benthica]|uniref:5-oxoprolinase subunit PxpB n=1 Tax=Shewanella benthica TaxID=43661 RepID=UPI00187B02D7|nr:5-oxoprolinase subunit PxpB [Shewanella benthica]MBE7216526.1 5-oxoprolinase subunit PxpB [Shewanella benthica]MCL1064653.1 5-oxoprolinase subunit PxpB [Shewanella benthica]
MSDDLQPKLFRLGEKALVLDCASLSGSSNKLEIQRQIWHIGDQCRASGDFDDIVPGNNNLTFFFKDSKKIPFWSNQINTLWTHEPVQDKPGKLIQIPVQYGGEYGPDLNAVAEYHKLTPQEVIAIHTSTQYNVLFLGFQPGFPYLDGLDKRLFTPRLATPRLSIPAGSVGIGGEQTGIYPAQSPGGWQIIGRSALALFDSASESGALLAPGDRVQFVSVLSISEQSILDPSILSESIPDSPSSQTATSKQAKGSHKESSR